MLIIEFKIINLIKKMQKHKDLIEEQDGQLDEITNVHIMLVNHFLRLPKDFICMLRI